MIIFQGISSLNKQQRRFTRYSSINIKAGNGYSSDTHQLTPHACFNVSIASISHQQALLQLDYAISYLELKQKLGGSLSIKGDVAILSAEAKVSYTKSVEEKEFTMSLNYYQYAHSNVDVEVGYPFLTELGKTYYANGHNKNFRLLCGDYFISSYQQGAMLMFSLNIHFKSVKEKTEFKREYGVSFLGIKIATKTVKEYAEKTRTTGKISVEGFQLGGDPSQLSYILNNNVNSGYYATACVLTNMDTCVKTASRLSDYAKTEFPKQFSFKHNKGLTPLGIHFTHLIPVHYIGLEMLGSLVTPKIKRIRENLLDKYKENEYYQQNLYPFINNGYPVLIDNDFKAKANVLNEKVDKNMVILMRQNGGALDCYNFPDKCENIAANINSNLENVRHNSDFKFIDTIKYVYTTEGGMFYNSGDGRSWLPEPFIEEYVERVASVYNVSISNEKYEYFTEVLMPPDSKKCQVKFTGSVAKDGKSYIGSLCKTLNGMESCVQDHVETKKISSFYFNYQAELGVRKSC